MILPIEQPSPVSVLTHAFFGMNQGGAVENFIDGLRDWRKY